MVGARARPGKPASAPFPSPSLELFCEICLVCLSGYCLSETSDDSRLSSKYALKSRLGTFWCGTGFLTSGPPYRAVVLKLEWALESPGRFAHWFLGLTPEFCIQQVWHGLENLCFWQVLRWRCSWSGATCWKPQLWGDGLVLLNGMCSESMSDLQASVLLGEA